MEPTIDPKPNLTPTPGFDPNVAAPAPTPTAPVSNVSSAPVGQVIGAPQVDPSLFVTEPVNPATMATPVVTGATQPVTAPVASDPLAAPGAMPAFGATDPLTMPEQPKAPDPVEEELKAPIKAAGPVPGSIGSAISVTPDGKSETPKPTKKKMDKNTMVLVGIVGGLVILALAIVLILQINS